MANAEIITDIKTKVISEIVHDNALFNAINSPDVKNFEEAYRLIGTHLFRYHMNPEVMDKAITFITVQVHLPDMSDDGVWSQARLEVWIISHVSCMEVNNIPKIVDSRTDYISRLLTEKFNNRDYLGLENDPGKISLYKPLVLRSNVEGAYTRDYLFRRMIFDTSELNGNYCGGYSL